MIHFSFFLDHAVGFGGKFGVQKDRVDKVGKMVYMAITNFG